MKKITVWRAAHGPARADDSHLSRADGFAVWIERATTGAGAFYPVSNGTVKFKVLKGLRGGMFFPLFAKKGCSSLDGWKNGWQVVCDGIRLFADDKLTQMKSRYEYIESKKKKAVAFPTLGILHLAAVKRKIAEKAQRIRWYFFATVIE